MPTSKQVTIDQLWLLSVSLYLREYCIFEEKIKLFYIKNIDNNKELLSYFYGGKSASNIHIEIAKMNFGIQSCLFDKEFKNVFSHLSISNIVKIDRQFSLTSRTNEIKINSATKKMVQYDFYTIVLALVNMRNLLAHETPNIKFKEECIIEVLPHDVIIKNMSMESIFEEISIEDCDDNTKIVQSNLYYMKLIIDELDRINSGC